jgi:hypothetical protein
MGLERILAEHRPIPAFRRPGGSDGPFPTVTATYEPPQVPESRIGERRIRLS